MTLLVPDIFRLISLCGNTLFPLVNWDSLFQVLLCLLIQWQRKLKSSRWHSQLLVIRIILYFPVKEILCVWLVFYLEKQDLTEPTGMETRRNKMQKFCKWSSRQNSERNFSYFKL